VEESPVELLERIPMSWEDYLRTPAYPKHEWVDGVCVVSPLASYAHQSVVRRLANLWEAALPGLFVYDGGNVRLPRHRVRIPDVVAFAAREEGVFNESTPELVAEVLSPSTRAEDTMRKSREYAEGGIDQYWVVDPELRRIDVFVNREGEWEPVLHVDDATRTGTVAVEPHGEVTVDLATVLD
jgi:Uma2 family endonuclease